MLPKPAGAACLNCPGRDAKCVPPERASAAASGGRARLVVVGEAPGRHELEKGRPFIGKSGKMLEGGLRTIGLTRSEVHWTNAILCDVDPKGMAKAAKLCRARLQAELAEAGAPVVMPVGAWGLQGAMELATKPQILKWRGTVNPHDYRGRHGAGLDSKSGSSGSTPESSAVAGDRAAQPERAVRPVEVRPKERDTAAHTSAGPEVRSLVCPTIHPAFVMRAPAWEPIIELDVARVGRVLRQGFTPPEEKPNHTLLIPRTIESLHAAMARLLPGAPCSFDVETVGLGPTHTALVCFGLSDSRTTIVVPWSREANGIDSWWCQDAPAVAAAVSRAFADRVCVTHNGPAFDHIVAARYGIRIAQWDDTLLAAHALAGHMKKNLHHVVTTAGDGAIDVIAWKQLEDRTATLERLWIYNGRDCLYTILAWLEMRKELQQ